LPAWVHQQGTEAGRGSWQAGGGGLALVRPAVSPADRLLGLSSPGKPAQMFLASFAISFAR